MSTHPSETRPTKDLVKYDLPAIFLHWALALLIVGTFCAGWYAADLAISPARLRLLNWHKWAGATVLALSIFRLLWRWARPAPPLPDRVLKTMPAWQQHSHHLAHLTLYILFFLVPLSGWSYSSASGFPVVLFGVLPIPDLVSANKDVAIVLLRLHQLSAFGLAAAVSLHVLAVIKHQWLDRDGLLSRMWPST